MMTRHVKKVSKTSIRMRLTVIIYHIATSPFYSCTIIMKLNVVVEKIQHFKQQQFTHVKTRT